jgi:meso-butanediol dehydrogenase/(S,S)-butanediol dehydrogenase/diacetyl reductase
MAWSTTQAGRGKIMGSLSGKVAIVTGGGTGIGRGIALALADAGASVTVCGRTAATLAAVRQEIEARDGRAQDVVCDITSNEDRRRLVATTLERFGAIDILINNAAGFPIGSLLQVDDGVLRAAWESGPMAALDLMRLCHPHLKGGGAIVNVSSAASIDAKAPGRGAYGAVKAALNALSRTAANEWAADGIRVNTIMPLAETEAIQRMRANVPERAAALTASIPMGRLGDCEADIGRAIVFLVGPDAGYLTGATLPLDGGTSYVR